MTTKILQIFLIQCFHSYLPFINMPTRVTGHSKILTDNIFYNKPMLNITAGNISSIISDHLIQFLIEPLQLMQNLNKHLNYRDAIRTLIRQNLKMTYSKSAGKNTVVI